MSTSELPYAAVSMSAPDGRAMEWQSPLWDAIHAYCTAGGEPAKEQAAAAVTRAVEIAMRLATAAHPEPRTPDETLAAWLVEFADDLPSLHWTIKDEKKLRVAAKRLRELAADRARLDWLERMVVNVRSATPYGSLDVFWASPPDEDDGPSDLRKAIDARQQLAQGGTDA